MQLAEKQEVNQGDRVFARIPALINAMLFLSVLTRPQIAFAEVCDKERPNWDPSQGPVSVWETFAAQIFTLPSLLFGAFLIYVILRGGRGFKAVTLGIVISVFVFTTLISDPIKKAAIQEGCLAASWPMQVLLLSLGGVLFAQIARSFRKA